MFCFVFYFRFKAFLLGFLETISSVFSIVNGVNWVL